MTTHSNPPGTPTARVVTDCCGRLLPESSTLRGDVHFTDLCPACTWVNVRAGSHVVIGDDAQPEHESHVTCTDGRCPGRDWTYTPPGR